MHLPKSIKNGPLGKTLTRLSLTGRLLQGPGYTWNCQETWRSLGCSGGTVCSWGHAGFIFTEFDSRGSGSMVVPQPFHWHGAGGMVGL